MARTLACDAVDVRPRGALQAVRAELAHARSLELTGELKRAREVAARARDEAAATPLQAAAQAQEGIVLMKMGALGEAEGPGIRTSASRSCSWPAPPPRTATTRPRTTTPTKL